jgi:hypothetical protein
MFLGVGPIPIELVSVIAKYVYIIYTFKTVSRLWDEWVHSDKLIRVLGVIRT